MKTKLLFIFTITLLIGCNNNSNKKSLSEYASSFSPSKRDSILNDYKKGFYQADIESKKRFPYESLELEANKSTEAQNKYSKMFRNNMKCYNDIIKENTANVCSKYNISIEIIHTLEELQRNKLNLKNTDNSELSDEIKTKIWYAYNYYQLKADRESKEDPNKSFDELWEKYDDLIHDKYHISNVAFNKIFEDKVSNMTKAKNWNDAHLTEQEYYHLMQ